MKNENYVGIMTAVDVALRGSGKTCMIKVCCRLILG